jgi:hypothetical protein
VIEHFLDAHPDEPVATGINALLCVIAGVLSLQSATLGGMAATASARAFKALRLFQLIGNREKGHQRSP